MTIVLNVPVSDEAASTTIVPVTGVGVGDADALLAAVLAAAVELDEALLLLELQALVSRASAATAATPVVRIRRLFNGSPS